MILAAGVGSRLRSAGHECPKCLVPIADRPLIDHQLDALRAAGVREVCLVVGHLREQVRARVDRACRLIVNERFAETNSLVSLWHARHWVRGSFALLNCDVLAHPDVYRRVLTARGTALAYDSSSGDDDEHMKVRVRDGCVQAMGKTLAPSRTDGENVGILKFDASAVDPLFDEVERLVSSDGDRHWAPAAVDRLARRLPVHAVDVADLPWTEIDYPTDLDLAERDVWPLIRSQPCRQPAVDRLGDLTALAP